MYRYAFVHGLADPLLQLIPLGTIVLHHSEILQALGCELPLLPPEATLRANEPCIKERKEKKGKREERRGEEKERVRERTFYPI